MGIIGSADEFWRLRVTRLDTTQDMDFEWHEDILFREPAVSSFTEVESWHVEAVSLAEDEQVVRLATFSARQDAEQFFDQSREDLHEMTRSQFEDAYLSSDNGEPHRGAAADEQAS